MDMKDMHIQSKMLYSPDWKDCYAQVRIRKAGLVTYSQEVESYEDIAEYLL